MNAMTMNAMVREGSARQRRGTHTHTKRVPRTAPADDAHPFPDCLLRRPSSVSWRWLGPAEARSEQRTGEAVV